jgi:hypothetical protein
MRRELSAILGAGLFLFSIPAWAQTPLNACDLVAPFGTVDQNDVNAAISMAIGATPCTADIMGTDVCNVVVTQRVVNAALGQPCIVGTHSVVLNWSASAPGTYPIAGYNVYRAPSSSPTAYVQLNTGLVTALTYTDGAVSNSASYVYAVKAVDTQNNMSAYSTPATANIPSS